MVVLRRIVFGLIVPRRALRWGRLTDRPSGRWWGWFDTDDADDVEAWHAALQPYRGFL